MKDLEALPNTSRVRTKVLQNLVLLTVTCKPQNFPSMRMAAEQPWHRGLIPDPKTESWNVIRIAT